MYCKYCGNNVPDGSKYCPTCGGVIEERSESFDSAPAIDHTFGSAEFTSASASPAVSAEAESKSTKALVFGILSLAFAGLLGLIFGIIGRKNANGYAALSPIGLDGKAKVGKILATVGIVVSIFTMVISVFSFIIGFIAALSEVGANGTITFN